MLSVVNADGSAESGSLIDEIVREGARRMLAAALEAEVNQYKAELAAEMDERGHRLVVRNGRHRPRTVATAAGPVEVTVPRVNDRRVDEATGERKRFSSNILAPWCRKSPKVSGVLPLLYLHGLSSGDFVPASLKQFLGSAAGLSPATVTRLTRQWGDDHTAFRVRDQSDRDFVYVWANGVHPKVRLGQAHSCALVLLGVRLGGTKEVIALAEGLRESTESTFSTVKLQTKVTRGAGSPAAALAMVFKLVESAQERRRTITRAHLVAVVRSGARFENTILVERTEAAA
ncbi:transposase [Streptomyces gardneri]|uniref:transposase n=1 Tax=Streptomyces gardneri TaxID=66892 RepID=UPI0036BC95DD